MDDGMGVPAIGSTQSSTMSSGPQNGSGPNVGGRLGGTQTAHGTARSLSPAQFGANPVSASQPRTMPSAGVATDPAYTTPNGG